MVLRPCCKHSGRYNATRFCWFNGTRTGCPDVVESVQQWLVELTQPRRETSVATIKAIDKIPCFEI